MITRMLQLCLFSLAFLVSCSESESSAERSAKAGILLISNNSEPQSLDPHKATSVSDGRIICALLEGLVRPDAKDATIMLPAVAESWTPNEDASQWIFTIRENALWSDGKPVLASDFEYAYKRLLHPQFGGKYSSMLYPIAGAEEFNKGKSTWDSVGVKVLGERSLQLTLSGPTPNLLQLMLHYTWFPVPAHAVEAHGGMLDRRSLWTKPANWVGNGAYILKEHRYNDYLEVSPAPTYWRKDEVKNKGVRFYPIVNGYTETRMFIDGKLHISNNVPPEMIAYAKKAAPEAYQQTPYYCTIFYRLNTARKPLNDLRVRQALSLAIDREALVDKVVRGAGQATDTFTPPSTGYEVDAPQLPATQEERIALAKKLLAEAGYPDGKNFPTLELTTTSREVQRIMAEIIQAFWTDTLGIRVQIQVKEWTAYKAAQQNGEYDFSSSAWSGDYLDPSSFVELWISGGGNNSTAWASDAFDAEITAARQSNDANERLQHLAAAERIMLDAQPIIPLYWSERCYLVAPMVKGFYPSLLETQPLDAVELIAD